METGRPAHLLDIATLVKRTDKETLRLFSRVEQSEARFPKHTANKQLLRVYLDSKPLRRVPKEH